MDQEQLPIHDLIVQFQHGSEAAGRQLWAYYRSLVRQAVRRRLPKRLRQVFDSEDFTQQVWASFFQDLEHLATEQLATFDEPAQLAAYLRTMAHNKVVEECRRRLGGVRRNEKTTRSLESSLVGEPSPRNRMLATPSQFAMEKELLTRVLASLPEDQRRIVELRFDGLTYKEVGDQVGMHENSVRRIMSNLYRRMME